MAYDDIIVGSGLTALATALGLAPTRRVLVLAGARTGQLQYYNDSRTVPRAFTGFGGLGNYWHGVIATGAWSEPSDRADAEMRALLHRFYPRTDVGAKLGEPWMFIPRRPIRPAREWPRLIAERGDRVQIEQLDADRFEAGDGIVTVHAGGQTFGARRLWLAAGTLHTPLLAEKSLGAHLMRPFVSDHMICYAGQIDRGAHPHVPAPLVERSPDGFWLKTSFDRDRTAVFMTKPARFGYTTLDYGIEQRMAFGLPTGGAVAKIARSYSPGLVSEALFNRFGVFPSAAMLSVYAQVLIRDAYRYRGPDQGLEAATANIAQAIADARSPWPEMIPTRRPDLYIQGIHLHHSIDLPALDATGLGHASSPVRIVDASILPDIGPEHPSFLTMARAYRTATQASA